MTTDRRRITVSGIPVDIVRKPIKNLHLGVYPPHGRVRVAAPPAVSDEAVRLAVVARLGWIKRQRAQFLSQPRQSEREMLSGESHYFLGQRYRLRVVERPGRPGVRRTASTLVLTVRPESTAEQRRQVMERWYRTELKALVPPLIETWQAALGVSASFWGIRRMKTKWGSCNAPAGRIWLNLELAKKPDACIEYLVVHELLHLLERRHSGRFVELLDRHLPDWRLRRDLLNAAPLAHETWEY